MADFDFKCSPPDGRIHITGELDLSTSAQLTAAIQQLSCGGCDHIKLELEDVAFIDAYSLGVLDKEQKRLETHGGDLNVITASKRYRRIALLAGYDNLQPDGNAQDSPTPA